MAESRTPARQLTDLKNESDGKSGLGIYADGIGRTR